MDHELNQINVIPLVDVMLVLLVIVLTTATFIRTGHIPVDLAKATEAEDKKEVDLVVSVTKKGRFYLDDQLVTFEQLKAQLRSKDHSTLVIVRADRQIALDRFVEVVAGIRGLGFEQVSLEVEKI